MADNSFVNSQSFFSLPQEALRKRNFLTQLRGGNVESIDPQQLAIALNAEAQLRSNQDRISREFGLREEELDTQRDQFNRSLAARDREFELDEAFRRDQLRRLKDQDEKNRRTALFAGGAKLGTQILFSPISFTSGAKGGTSASTIASKIPGATIDVLKFFKII